MYKKMKLSIILATIIVVFSFPSGTSAKKLKFNEGTRYSRLALESRTHDFYGNMKPMGFPVFVMDGTMDMDTPLSNKNKTTFDYVPGLVARATMEAVDLYKEEAWARSIFYSVEWYANLYYNKVPDKGGSLDDLNSAKIYFPIYELTKEGGLYAHFCNDSTLIKAKIAIDAAVRGLQAHIKKYSIKDSQFEDARGGMWHKKSYPNQMWLDGQYMGPVLMAQLINYGRNVTGSAESDWDFITNQLNITWNHLWDKDKHLLYHAFSATPTDSLSSCWADPVTGRSQEFWARAEGWYFLALVDILEEMQKAKVTGSGNYTILRQHLNELAKGIAQYQEQRTGCWYQLIDKGAGYNASSYKGVDMATKHNYLESSASALFIAAYYKGMRLALLDDDYSAMCEKAYRGFIETFVVDDHSPFGGIDIIGSCRSAGLGGKAKRDGSAPYYLLGPDVSVVKERDMQTEGKALGAFILAAIEYERAHPQA